MSQFAIGVEPEGTLATQDLVDRKLRERRAEKVKKIALGLGFPLLLLLAWELLVHAGVVDGRFFPPPSKLASSIGSFLADAANRDLLLTHTLVTLQRLAVGYTLGAVSGVAIGVLMGLSPAARYAVAPLIYGLFPMPKIAIYPLMIVIFGIGDASSQALVMIGVLFMTAINTLNGVLYTNPIYADVAKAFRMPATTTWFRVAIPAAMPSIITGLRLGLGQALILVVSSEFVSADFGVGRFIWDNWQILNIPRMFMGLAVIVAMGGVAAMIGNFAERKLIPWAQH
jgi:NitT/TauT family transport system permease protein